jgi:hypothetical protein
MAGVVPLDGSALRLLATPAQRGQHLPDMPRVIANPKFLVHQFGYPRQRPELRAMPGVEGPWPSRVTGIGLASSPRAPFRWYACCERKTELTAART